MAPVGPPMPFLEAVRLALRAIRVRKLKSFLTLLGGVIGDEVGRYFFPALDPVGRQLRIGGIPYTVIGVIEHQGNLFGISMDKTAFAPFLSPLHRLTNPRGDVDGILVQAPNDLMMNDAMETTREVMRGRRGLRPGQKDNFVMETSASALASFEKVKNIMTIAGSALPAIGLIVGGLVIMNIMVVAVAERTREIGIRKALGARRKDILRQFLVEAATLSTLGAVIGIGFGILGAKVISWNTLLPAAVAPWSLAVATMLGMGVGIVSGVYPARRAAPLDPIEALRQEEPMRSLLSPLAQIFDGVGIAFDALQAQRVRALLTLMGVALGVFVVVAMSSVVQGINESFRRDVEAAGPTSFFVYRRPIGGFNVSDGTRETCPERRNPGITLDEVAALDRLPTIRAVTAHIGSGASFRYKDRLIPRTGLEIYSPNWTEVDGGDIYPGRSFTEAENAAGARVALVNDKMAEILFAGSDPLGKGFLIDGVQFTVI